MESIADRLRKAMDIRDMKQADIIEKTGINKGALSSYLSGRYKPKQDNIFLLAKALNVSEAWLMGADVPMDRVEARLNELAEKKILQDQISSLDLTPLELEFVELFVKLPAEKKTLIIQIMKSYL